MKDLKEVGECSSNSANSFNKGLEEVEGIGSSNSFKPSKLFKHDALEGASGN